MLIIDIGSMKETGPFHFLLMLTESEEKYILGRNK